MNATGMDLIGRYLAWRRAVARALHGRPRRDARLSGNHPVDWILVAILVATLAALAAEVL